jgi:hypothetical protein
MGERRSLFVPHCGTENRGGETFLEAEERGVTKVKILASFCPP